MKYKSELIKEIVEARGHEKSSLHYESECIESWIEETKGAYPKLCDYQSEWLNYINENPLGEFPYETVTDVTNATIENVVPYEYKSAILKGQTLVNLATIKSFNFHDNAHDTKCYEKEMFKPSTTYTIILDITSSNNVGWIRFDNTDMLFPPSVGHHVLKGVSYSTLDDNTNTFRIDGFVGTIDNLMILEGDYTNVDIPYFEGMQSVKMPVLKTNGKNLWNNYQLERGSISHLNGENLNQYTTQTRSKDYIPIVPNTKYIATSYSFDGTTSSDLIRYYDSEKKFIGISPNEKSTFLRTVFQMDIDNISHIQLERGTQATSYEPFKSNILTVNDDVTLRGVGNVQDELNLLTGELTERLITKTYDGSENWSIGHSNTDEKLIYFQMNDGDFKNVSSIVAINNLVGEYRNPYADPIYNTMTIVFSSIRIRLGSEINTLELFKDYLSKNNLIITAERSQKSIKTVDLTVIDQDGNTLSRIKPIEGTMHIHSDGTPLKPSITMEIPVEATTQNLYSFIEEE